MKKEKNLKLPLAWKVKKYFINRKYKDVLFRLVLADKKVLLKLYNALNETDYDDEGELKINTLADIVYLGYKNDLSFIIGNTVNLYEHQSTINPNMPLRGLRYISVLYNVYIKMADKNEYGTKLVRLPRPQCIVFYNGAEHEEERKTLRLSDAYYDAPNAKHDPCLEFTATVININYGMNKGLMSKCRELEEYAIFIDRVYAYQKQGLKLNEALNRAIDECIDEDILSDILEKNRAEVISMMMTTYDKKKHYRVLREEGREEGEELANKKWEAIVADQADEIKRLKEQLRELNKL
ncbi:MAG: hypothetical protein FWG91_09760 [Lachnospiraceae bacterium]|nr:hypothetical protein [Lachnospiraceae bacterium]